jgi:selenide,water dikinase
MSELAQVLRPLLPMHDPRALVDVSTGDDAAVYLLDSDNSALPGGRALVVTLDFFTPMVDDALDFGRIAAANALSDIYAMGARPLFALNLLGFPRKLLHEGLVEDIMRGGAEVTQQAGEVARDQLITIASARAGDRLVLTKALGTGIITTALKNDVAEPAVVEAAIGSMTKLNASASEAMQTIGVHAATDVTGFGLLGHLRNLLRASGCAATIDAASVPMLPGALELARQGEVPGGSHRNLTDLADDVTWADQVDEATRLLLCDAQTSGGLLISVAADRCDALCAELTRRGDGATVIGTVADPPSSGGTGHISVR